MKEIEFTFYLDAVHYCRKNDIDLSKIEKKSFKVWMIKQ